MTPRTLIWDIEASNLSANFGFILCIGYKWLDEGKPKIISIRDFPLYKKDPTNDREVVKAFKRVFEEAEIHVAHFGKYFDTPYVNTRLLYHGLSPLPRTRLDDTWKMSKDNLKLNSNRLATITEFFGLTEKTPVTGPHWIKAMAGNKQSLRYVEKHCYYDIEALEETYRILKQFKPVFPAKVLDGKKSTEKDRRTCPHCHKQSLIKRGYALAASKKYQRYQCTKPACTKWATGSSAIS